MLKLGDDIGFDCGTFVRYRCVFGAASLVIKGQKIDAKTSPLARLSASMKGAFAPSAVAA